MFSIITIASSTTKPVEIVSAMSERLSRLYPSRYMTPKVPTIERGTATLGMMVADGLRRKRNSTITTSATVSIRENSTSCTDARIVVVRSVRTFTWTDGGSAVESCGSSRSIRSTTPMMFAPGWRWMFMMTAGTPSIHAACFTFSASSLTSATSERRTGAPFR